MTSNSTIKLIKELDVTDLAGEKVMIDFETGKYYMLKGVANTIWDYIQSPIRVEDIITKLLSEYDVDVDTCTLSVHQFIDQLLSNHIVEVLQEANTAR